MEAKIKPQDLNTSQLRLGNILQDDRVGIPIVVCRILRNSIKAYGLINNSGEYDYDLGEFSPVPLTEDILVRLGARRIGKSNDFSINGVIIHKRKRGWVINTKIPVMHYVHQFQNFMHTNRGTELTLNP